VSSNRLAAVLLGLVLVVGSAAAGVTVHSDDQVDFSAFETYAWEKGLPAVQPQVEQWIVDSVNRHLQAAGLKKVEGEADVMVSSHTFAESLTSEDMINPGYWGPEDDFGIPTVSVGDFRKGTLAIRIRDRAEDRVVWRGVATATVKNASEKKMEDTVTRAIRKMFEKFPRR
jgi:hypothetical protein